MQLEVVIDVGDTRKTPKPIRRRLRHRPSLVVFAVHGGRRIPLVRWPTTVGGWQDKRLRGGFVAKRYMGSELGEFVWRDLYVAPRWLPPDNTPDEDVVKRDGRGRWVLDRPLFGPSYRSAYGLAMLVHHVVSTHRGQTNFIDRGIRTHGTGNTLSLRQLDSHGCHRLLGAQVNRLAAFLLRHRKHIRHGSQPTIYRRVFRYHGRFPITIRERGHRFEMTPPIPVVIGKKL
jgi:hypothetical protein